ncbi:hypothetical protein VTK73DRAFT_3336 [Phialemonium thermophilum]|uniref:HhH-GPD domain-containing protein n=1 Tax=Phialemonium thermophilum TaxID=223376 RepID=A0ABR3VJU7_9PEZI
MAAVRRSARLNNIAGNVAANPMPPPAPTRQSKKRKVQSEKARPVDATGSERPTPSTPRKRQAKSSAINPPQTPTPSTAQLVAEGTGRGDPRTPSRRPMPSAVARLADPSLTNAVLLSPETSRLISAKPIDTIPPSKVAMRTTTATILEEACAHLINVDPRMKPLIDAHHCRIFSPEGLAEKIDPFESLASGIISQQVSGAAAKAIKSRFVALFDSESNGRFPHPSEVAATPLEKLRLAGLSQRKAEYVVGLAEKFASGELSAQMLADAPYDEVLEKLTAVRGLGRWSAEMFACFGLKRMDVFSVGDLGVQRGMAAFVGRDVAKLKNKGGKWKYMTEQEMVEISDRFRPFRSVFMWYMWRVEQTDVSTLE